MHGRWIGAKRGDGVFSFGCSFTSGRVCLSVSLRVLNVLVHDSPATVWYTHNPSFGGLNFGGILHTIDLRRWIPAERKLAAGSP